MKAPEIRIDQERPEPTAASGRRRRRGDKPKPEQAKQVEAKAEKPKPEKPRKGPRRTASAPLPLRLLVNVVVLYLVIGLAFGVARFGWGALVAAMAEPDESAFIAGIFDAVADGAQRTVMWAPSLYLDVIADGRDFFDWLLYR